MKSTMNATVSIALILAHHELPLWNGTSIKTDFAFKFGFFGSAYGSPHTPLSDPSPPASSPAFNLRQRDMEKPLPSSL